jgi:hypothetical protein
MRFGRTKETTTLDEYGSTITVIRNIRNFETMHTYKQFTNRSKVKDAKEEMVEFMKHSDNVRQKKLAGVLVIKDDDKSLQPHFVVEYPKHDIDGSYFVISSWTEVV